MQHSFETIAAPPAKEANEKFLSYPSSCIKSTIWLAKIVPMKNRVTGSVSARGGYSVPSGSHCACSILLKLLLHHQPKRPMRNFSLYPSSCIKSTIWLANFVPMKNRVTGCVSARGGYSVPSGSQCAWNILLKLLLHHQPKRPMRNFCRTHQVASKAPFDWRISFLWRIA